MESMNNIRERFAALEQQTKPLQQHTRTTERRLRWGHIPSSCSQPPGQGV
jgi:hypothetical protein